MVRLHCPMCGEWRTVPSLEAMIEEAKKGWERLKPTKEQMEYINRINSKERLQKILKQKGYLEVFCQVCITRVFIQLAQKHRLGVDMAYGLS